MTEPRGLTTEAGAPVTDNQHSQTAGPTGPTLLQGSPAHREARALQPRAHPRARRPRGGLGRLRLSRSHQRRGIEVDEDEGLCRRRPADAGVPAHLDGGRLARRRRHRARPARLRAEGLQQDGNWDLVGNNTPIFFIRDGIKFPAKNYEPNSYDGPAQSGEPFDGGYSVAGAIGPAGHVRHAEDDDFVQAGALHRVTRPAVVDRSIEHFRRADREYGDRLAAAVAARRR